MTCSYCGADTSPWLTEARKHQGQSEVPGWKSNKWILSLWDTVPWIWSTVSRQDDSVLPWCGAFVRHCLVEANIQPPKHWYRAKAYVNFGTKLYEPTLGAVCVIKNSAGKFHVGIIVGVNNAGHVLIIGGNQSDSVKVSAFLRDSVEYIGWPGDIRNVPPSKPPILSAALSDSEA